MAHFFNNHPTVSYDLNKNNTPINVQNPLVRFIYKEALKDRTAWYYTHDIAPGQSIQYIAEKYYGDARYDWVLMITNDILDPVYDLPLEQNDFIAFIRSKYGSVPAAQGKVKHYEQILADQTKLADGTIIPKQFQIVDETTYNTLIDAERREVDCYTYEDELNESKRTIKILRREWLPSVLASVKDIFN
jgi:hypothetical protein